MDQRPPDHRQAQQEVLDAVRSKLQDRISVLLVQAQQHKEKMDLSDTQWDGDFHKTNYDACNDAIHALEAAIRDVDAVLYEYVGT